MWRLGAAFGIYLLGGAGVWAQEAHTSQGADMRFLDRLTGQISNFQLTAGTPQQIGQLNVLLQECRYPAQSANADAFALLDISDAQSGQTYFKGWMVASSPALNALEHKRYDLWVLRCTQI